MSRVCVTSKGPAVLRSLIKPILVAAAALTTAAVLIGAAAWVLLPPQQVRGCTLCHPGAESLPLPEELTHAVLRARTAAAHPYLLLGAEDEVADWLYNALLPRRAASRSGSAGRALYRAKCAACHGADGAGQPGRYPPLLASEWLLPAPPPHASAPDASSRLPEILASGLSGPISVRSVPYNATMLPPRIKDPATVRLLIDYLRREFLR